MTLITPESALDERLKALADRVKGSTTIDDKVNRNDRNDSDFMSRPTKNLTAPYAVRLRHDQRVDLTNMINAMTSDEIDELTRVDRAKFSDSEGTKNLGRPSNPIVLIIRTAVDEHLSRHQSSLDSLPLFKHVSKADRGDDE